MTAKRFEVRPRLLDESALWCWEIRDAVTDQLVETSWSREWVAYDSPGDAVIVGERRLAVLAERRPGSD
jgi:hypothetical protein